MQTKKKIWLLLVLIMVIFSVSGCSLLQIPGALIGGVFKILGGVLGVAKKLPWWLWI